jgi:hypothetical protein
VFMYDGDGKRVKSVITTNVGTTTTYFVGTHYEVADGVVTKYYYAGEQRGKAEQSRCPAFCFGCVKSRVCPMIKSERKRGTNGT